MEISVSKISPKYFEFIGFFFRDWFFTGYDSVKNYGFRETSRWCFSYLSTKGFDTFYGYGHLTRVCISWVYIGTGPTNLTLVASIFWSWVSFGFTKKRRNSTKRVSYQIDNDLVHIRFRARHTSVIYRLMYRPYQGFRVARTKID